MLGDGRTHGSAGLVEEHRARPALHRHDVDRCRDPEMVVEEPRQLADRHAVAHRDRELADERRIRRVERGSLDRDHRRSDSADRTRRRGCRAGGRRAGSSPSCRCRCRCACRHPGDRRRGRRRRRASRGSARASRCTASTRAPGVCASVACADSIMFSCRSDRNPCWGPKIAVSVQVPGAARGDPRRGGTARRSRPGCRRDRLAGRQSGRDPGHRGVVRFRGARASAES